MQKKSAFPTARKGPFTSKRRRPVSCGEVGRSRRLPRPPPHRPASQPYSPAITKLAAHGSATQRPDHGVGLGIVRATGQQGGRHKGHSKGSSKLQHSDHSKIRLHSLKLSYLVRGRPALSESRGTASPVPVADRGFRPAGFCGSVRTKGSPPCRPPTFWHD